MIHNLLFYGITNIWLVYIEYETKQQRLVSRTKLTMKFLR